MNTRNILVYILLSYGISWSIWLPNVIAAQGDCGWQHSNALHLIGGFGPFLAALISTLLLEEKQGLINFVRQRYLQLPRTKWVIVGIGMPIVFFLIAYLFMGIMKGQWLIFSTIGLNSKLPFQQPFLIWLLWCLCYGLGEESGWRGYLFPAINQKYSAGISALLIAIIWALWHLPVFFYDKDFMRMGMGGTLGWLVGLCCGSIVLSWLVKQSKWNILPVILWHGTFNFFTSSDQIDFVYPAIISSMVMVFAFYLWLRWGKRLGIADLSLPS